MSIVYAPTYRASFTVAAPGGGGLALEFIGAAGRVMRLYRLRIESASVNTVLIHKYAALAAGGVFTVQAPVAYDTAFPASQATLKQYTTAPAPASGANDLGPLDSIPLAVNTVQDTVIGGGGGGVASPLTLRSATDTIGLLFSSAGVITGFLEFIEESA